MIIHLQICDEAPSLAQLLGFGKTKVGLLNLRFRPFSIVDVCGCSIPFYDASRFVAQSVSANQKPPIPAVETTKACFNLSRFPSKHDGSPVMCKPLQVVRVNGYGPSPVQRLFRRETRVIEPALIEEVDRSVWTS